MTELIGKWVTLCEQSIKESKIGNTFTRLPLQKTSQHVTGPEDAMQMDLVPEPPPSVDYKNYIKPWTCSPDVCLHTLRQTNTPQNFPELLLLP